jgi:transcriptional regulator with XRE-family HTH domain
MSKEAESRNKDLIKLGKHIRKLREQKQMSLRDMSYACELDHSKISRIENGAINITYSTILQLAKALELPPYELLHFTNE